MSQDVDTFAPMQVWLEVYADGTVYMPADPGCDQQQGIAMLQPQARHVLTPA